MIITRYIYVIIISVACCLGFGTLRSEVTVDSSVFFDKARQREVPVAFYFTGQRSDTVSRKLVILSHGYGGNKRGSNTLYGYLARHLASEGYFVVSIQHDLPTDEPPATTGNLKITRMPAWQKGVANILFIMEEMKKSPLSADYKNVILIGHSYGGDISMLFATQYPELVSKVISLDNRRMPLPRTKKPRIYSLRSNDLPADEGVLPEPFERQKNGMKIIMLENTGHSSMDDSGSAEQHKEITELISVFLKE